MFHVLESIASHYWRDITWATPGVCGASLVLVLYIGLPFVQQLGTFRQFFFLALHASHRLGCVSISPDEQSPCRLPLGLAFCRNGGFGTFLRAFYAALQRCRLASPALTAVAFAGSDAEWAALQVRRPLWLRRPRNYDSWTRLG